MKTTTILRQALLSTLLAASATTWAAGFAPASGERSAADQAAVAAAGTGGTTRESMAPRGRTRAEVMAEFELARCRGELPFDGETGRTEREVFPARYPLPQCR